MAPKVVPSKEGKKIILNISGMHCASCSQIIEMQLQDLVKNVKVSHVRGVAEIEFDENKTSEKAIKEVIIKSGYKVS